MKCKKTIFGYQVRNKNNDGIRFYSSSLTDCIKYCPFGCAIWSTTKRTYGIKLRFFWMSPFRKIRYDKYSNVVNFFHLHVGWELMKKEVPVEIVYEPKDNSNGKEIGSTGKKSGGAPCMIVFCAFEQMMYVIEKGKEYGFKNYIPLQFYKNYSPQVLKANMRVVGNTEYAILLYRNRLPKFNNNGRMVFNAIPYPRDTETAKVHPTQKSVPLLCYLIELFTDPNDVVIDPCAGSGSTLLAAAQCGRRAYGFEIKKDFFREANEKVLSNIQKSLF